jgi:hypothetical protein
LRPTFSFRRRNEAKAFGDADRAVDNAATQNKVTQSCGLSLVVGFSMIYPEGSCWFRSGLFSAVVWPTHGRVMVIAAAAVHRERPRDRCAAEQRDELAAALISITSSAIASSVGGIPITAPVTWKQVENGIRPDAFTMSHPLRP